MKKDDRLWKCSLCDRWSANGVHRESGNRDPRTGETPCDNFICQHCEQKVSDERAVRDALKAWEKRQRAA